MRIGVTVGEGVGVGLGVGDGVGVGFCGKLAVIMLGPLIFAVVDIELALEKLIWSLSAVQVEKE